MSVMQNTLFAKPDYTLHRSVEGAPIIADSTTFSTLLTANPRVPIDCLGYETVRGFIKLTGGTTPTVDLQPLELAIDTDSTQLIVSAATTASLSSLDPFEFTIHGGKLFVRIDAVTGTPTGLEIFLSGSKRAVSDWGRKH